MSQLNKSLLIYCNLQMMREKKEPLIRTRRRKSRLNNSPYLCMRWTILTKNLLEGTINRLTAKKIISLRSLPPSPGAAIIQFRKELLAGLNIHLKSHYLNHPCNCVQKWQVPNSSFYVFGTRKIIAGMVDMHWMFRRDLYSYCIKF